uniref:DnaJ homolog subfamily C member 10 n=1 Tax=Gadus morhua TaxID=8049 RepID=A0A8C5CJN7_GADMO
MFCGLEPRAPSGHRSLPQMKLLLVGWLLASVWAEAQDYYNLLGVGREATVREIRQAFKKLALTMHPDKKPNDKSAHDAFLKINRAYEVLKDEDLRKKYDKYGEKGLDEQQGGRYESWNYYRYDFGIYDEDLEIITLDRGDFDAAVNSGEIWFINFYFPRCSHCHQLAPTWREVAKEMDGVIRIGAVNCGDNGHLCRSKGINSYPSLYVYRAGQVTQYKFLIYQRFIILNISSECFPGNVFTEIEQAFSSGVGWLITFCSETGGKTDRQTDRQTGLILGTDTFQSQLAHHRWLVSFTFGEKNTASNEHKKLKAMLRNDHIQVGRLDCMVDAELCLSLYIQKSCLAVFKGMGVSDFEVHHGKNVLYNIVGFARESVSAHVTTLLPDNFPSDRKEPWLVDFFTPWCPPCRALLPELRKASIQLAGQMRFGTLDCTIHHHLCSMYKIQAYPTTVIFNRSSLHEYEGQHSADGILEFIQDLASPSVSVLDPESFQRRVKGRAGGEIWAVDFYAPWCGPCQALLPEWRRMARLVAGQVMVGSMDCQKHQSFCRSQGVRAYPEIRLYPSQPSPADTYMTYSGWNRDAQSLRMWTLSALPRVSVDLSPESFRDLVLLGPDHWVLDFYAPWCGPCQHFAPEFEVLARMVKGEVRSGKLDCQAHQQTCQSAGITAYPTVLGNQLMPLATMYTVMTFCLAKLALNSGLDNV